MCSTSRGELFSCHRNDSLGVFQSSTSSRQASKKFAVPLPNPWSLRVLDSACWCDISTPAPPLYYKQEGSQLGRALSAKGTPLSEQGSIVGSGLPKMLALRELRHG